MTPSKKLIIEFNNSKDKIIIRIKVKTNAPKSEIVSMLENGVYKLNISAKPIEGRANLEIIKFFTEFFKINKKQISIKSGKTSQNKIIEIKI